MIYFQMKTDTNVLLIAYIQLILPPLSYTIQRIIFNQTF